MRTWLHKWGLAGAGLAGCCTLLAAIVHAGQIPPFVAPVLATTPSLSLSEPLANGVYAVGDPIALAATVRDRYSRVEFYVDAMLVGSSSTAPYMSTWSPPSARTYTVTAVGVGISGVRDLSASAQITVTDPLTLPLVQQSSLRYVGAFRLPPGKFGGSSFGVAGPMAFNAQNQSLYMVGHDWDQMVAEIKIPTPVVGALGTLPVATVLQPFSDPTDGKLQSINPGDPNSKKVGGLLPWGDKLIVTAYSYYDGSGSQVKSHFASSRDLNNPTDAQGPFVVGSLRAGVVSGYMSPVPMAWRSIFGAPAFTGNCCLSVIGRTSFGPAIFAFDPADVGVKDPVPTNALLNYPAAHPLASTGATSTLFNGTSHVKAALMPEGTRSLLFFGRHGIGPYCYGEGGNLECKDPEVSSKGEHAYPYVYRVWAYDAAELAEVKGGRKQTYDPKPYGVWNLDLPFKGWSTGMAGAAYDPVTKRLYMSIALADGERPVIVVYQIET